MILISKKNIPSDILTGIEELKKELDIDFDNSGVCLTLTKCSTYSVYQQKNNIELNYTEKSEIFRALKYIFTHKTSGKMFRRKIKNLSVMLDCSRNAVPNIEYLKSMIRKLAILGYNQLQLYTEETYEVNELPYFGHMRGRFTQSEILIIQSYCETFGIDLVPCIQTLAHLPALFKWQQFANLVDTSDILLVDSDETYVFLEKIFISIRNTFKSKKINIGMDEAHLIGGGRYLDKNGYCPRQEILLRHLGKVVELCKKYQFEPMMWSDMFFRINNNSEYYVSENNKTFSIPSSTVESVPKEVTLIYWDYYYEDKSNYDCMFKNHNRFNNPIAFAGASWKWLGFAPNIHKSMRATKAALSSLEHQNIDLAIVTCWGDNGAECAIGTIFAILVMYSQFNFDGDYNDYAVAMAMKAYLNYDLSDFFSMDLPNMVDDYFHKYEVINPSKYLLYNDPLIGLMDFYVKDDYPERFALARLKLQKIALKNHDLQYVFLNLANLCYVLELKSNLGVNVKKAYDNNDNTSLNDIATKTIPQLLSRINKFKKSFSAQWETENKPFGKEIIDMRLGALSERISQLKHKIQRYTRNEILSISELDECRLPYLPCDAKESLPVCIYRFEQIFSPSLF